jgi:hypothetical protein
VEAKPVGPVSPLGVVVGSPSISADMIDQVLCKYGSPACHQGDKLYSLGKQYGIDSAYALAFFWHESQFGTTGEARKTLSLGNLRCIDGAACVDQDRGGYAAFGSWEEGFKAWFVLIRGLYVDQWGLKTVDSILTRYAPTADGNSPARYSWVVRECVALWRAGKVEVA